MIDRQVGRIVYDNQQPDREPVRRDSDILAEIGADPTGVPNAVELDPILGESESMMKKCVTRITRIATGLLVISRNESV